MNGSILIPSIITCLLRGEIGRLPAIAGVRLEHQ